MIALLYVWQLLCASEVRLGGAAGPNTQAAMAVAEAFRSEPDEKGREPELLDKHMFCTLYPKVYGGWKATWSAAFGTAVLKRSCRWVWRKLCTTDVCGTPHAKQLPALTLAVLDGFHGSLPSFVFRLPHLRCSTGAASLLLRRFWSCADSLGPSTAMHAAAQRLFRESPWDLQGGCERRGVFDEAGSAQVFSSNTRDDGSRGSAQ